MSNYLTNNEASARATGSRSRRKLWLASGVAGLTGVVSLAAVGVAGSAGAVGVSGLKWNTTQQVTKDGDQGRGDEGRGDEGPDRGDKDDHDGKDRERGKEVPCDTDRLIQAIVFANSRDGGVLDLAKGCTYNLTRNQDGNGLPVITQDITLRGEHTTITRDATADYFRILNVGPGGHLSLKGLTIKGGQTIEALQPVSPAAVWGAYSDSQAIAAQVKAGTPLAQALAARKANPKAGLKAAPKAARKAAVKAAPSAKAKPGKATTLVEEPGVNDGAGILVQPGGTANLFDTSVVLNQSGGNGGGLANFGTTSLRHTEVAHNTAFFFGGGIFNAGLLQVDESTITDNTAIVGGGGISNGAAEIFTEDVDGGTVLIEKSKITDNETLGFGGGVLDIGGNTTVRYTELLSNTAVLAGGGLAVADAQVNVDNSTVAKNSTAGVGGGVAVAFDSAVTIEKSHLKENTAGFFGGGLFNADSVTTVRESEVVANRALGPIGVGGGIFNIFGEVNLSRTKVVNNFATLAPGGVFTFEGVVNVDDKSAIVANRPTNCLAIPGDTIPNCFG
ncbi:hypothetical protein B5D80_21135 [Micromonospora wenchangensis]|uniref:Right handed beta helix domain-containing protein n=1 Tax=Micromonospora wenchangensis TaxID=1185415 RepID=A0A246RI14_9ACTN|nr:hypothetical protein [Micromonospora wenchangensis]OWV04019.1 hypothetical protein B5D80_21135 [Micromonospora wenchangensis]